MLRIALALTLGFILIHSSGCQPTGKEAPQPSSPAVKEQKSAPPGWQVIGPGGGGSQYEPTISPHDPKVVFVRCDMTGAYVTHDAGRSWRMFNLRTVVQDFEFDPNDPNVVYASNTGLYRSEDRGVTWSLVYPAPANVTGETMNGDHADQRFVTTDGMPDGSIGRVRVDPADSRHLLIGLTPGRSGGGNCRILASVDRGATWKQLAVVPGSTVHAIFPGAWRGDAASMTVVTDRACVRLTGPGGQAEILTLPAEEIVMADGGVDTQGKVYYYVLTEARQDGGGLFRSTDSGVSWESASGALLSGLPEGANPPQFQAFAVCANRPQTVYLSCGSYPVLMEGYPQSQGGVLKSVNAGDDWQWTLTVCGGSILSRNYGGGWLLRWLGWFRNPSVLGVCPSNADICYGTDSGRTIKTEDGGVYWQQVISEDLPDGGTTTRGLDVTTTYGVHFDPYDPKHLFITYTDIGLFHSWDGGKSWAHSITGIPRQWRNTCYWLVFDPAVRGRIWSVWSNVHDLPRPKMHHSGNLVNGRAQGGVAVSTDGGRWWELCNTGVMEDGRYVRGLPLNSVCTHITLDEKSPVEARTLYVCEYGHGVYKSVDGGETWELRIKGLGENRQAWRTVLLPDGRLILLVARGGLEGRGYVDGALYESTDGAGSWKKMILPEGANAPNDLVFDPVEPNRLYLSCWPRSTENGESGGGLYRSEDGGKLWGQVFDGRMHVYAAAVDPANPSTVFINTFDSAAFRSDDRGETWQRLRGYNFKWGHRPAPDPHNPEMLYLTTFGGSVYYGPARGVPGAVEDIVNLPEDRLYFSPALK